MNQKVHPGPHPDADQLSIFAEGAATAREREQMLAHLAECRECRDVVFLMQRPVEALSATKETPKGWAWQGWFVPTALAGAALAGLAALLIYVRPSTKVAETNQKVAIEQPAAAVTPAPGEPVAPIPNPAPTAREDRDQSASLGGFVTNGLRQKPAGPSRNAADQFHGAGVAGPATAAAAISGSVPATAQVAPPNPQSQLNSSAIQETLRGRNVMSQQPAQASAGARALAPTDNLAQQSPPLRVERTTGQDATLSGISGRVTDISGAVVSGALVALRDTSGSTRQTATGPDGSFRLTGIAAGHYDLTVTAPGFKSNQQAIDLKPSELAMLQPVLSLGSVTQTVEVTAAAAPLETDASSVVSTAELPSRLSVASSVSLGKRMLSLDAAGSLYLSHNAGKNWKKVHPQWAGRAVRLDLAAPEPGEASDKSQPSGQESTRSVFQLTTDSGAQWISKDGTRWRPR